VAGLSFGRVGFQHLSRTFEMRTRTVRSKILRRLATYADATAQSCHKWYCNQELADGSLGAAKTIHTHMTTRELHALYDLATAVGRSGKVLEIGSYLGASSCYVAAALSLLDGHLYCVDTWENQTMPDGKRDTFREFERNTGAVAAFITPVRKRSDEIVASDFAQPLDLIFIDADHSYSSVRGDYERVRNWVIDGGILAFHDCTYFESVSRVLGEVLASGSWQLSGSVDSLVWLRKIGPAFPFPNPMCTEECSAPTR
jgi:predicted O-methyltransferase YrrM